MSAVSLRVDVPRIASAKVPVILVVDDELQIRRALTESLVALPARVLEARTAAEALALAMSDPPDLVVLDLGLPDRPGIEVCSELRRWSNAPIVVLSARHAESEKIHLLNAGADDYVSKPFSLGEFIARVQAQLRRANTAITDPQAAFRADEDLRIDFGKREVRRGARKIKLTRTEWAILRTLVAHGSRPVSHQQIFDAVWGRAFGNPQQYLRVYVTHLRRKIERDPATPRVIITEPGFGYRFESNES